MKQLCFCMVLTGHRKLPTTTPLVISCFKTPVTFLGTLTGLEFDSNAIGGFFNLSCDLQSNSHIVVSHMMTMRLK